MTTQIALEKIKYATFMQLTEEFVDDYFNRIEVDISEHSCWDSDNIAVRTTASAMGRMLDDTKITKYPSSWWDAFKIRFFPYKLLRRFPANYTDIIVSARELYPEIAIPDTSRIVTIEVRHGIHNQ